MLKRPDSLTSCAGLCVDLALTDLFARDGLLTGQLHHRPRSTRVVHAFMAGTRNHVHTFDYEPLLEKRDGPPWNPVKAVELPRSTPNACCTSRPTGDEPTVDLYPPQSCFSTTASDKAALAALAKLNAAHAEQQAGDDRLATTVRSHQLAAGMQFNATDPLDLASEPQHIHGDVIQEMST